VTYDNPGARHDDEGVIEFRDDENSKISRMFSLDYLYTKKQFKRIVKWCSEDPSNLWYDHMEQALADFAEAKQIYKSEVLRADVETCETNR
jgi:predicted transcriptional regulator